MLTDPPELKYATVEVLELSPLPCWAHLSPEAYRQRVATLLSDIESAAKLTGVETTNVLDPQWKEVLQKGGYDVPKLLE